MDDQHEAWRRMTDARLRYLEMAVSPPRVRLARSGRPRPPEPYEPGDRQPLTRWLEVRVLAIELLLRLLLDADSSRADELDVHPLEDAMNATLWELDSWSQAQVEPDVSRRETMAVILLARVILMETPTWPLEEMESE